MNPSLACAQNQGEDLVIDQMEQLNCSIERVAAKVAPAIVRIDVLCYSPPDENDFKDKSEAHLVSKKRESCFGNNPGFGWVHRNKRSRAQRSQESSSQS